MKGRAYRFAVFVAVILATGLLAGCSLEDPAAPALTAPSEFATSVTLVASPDQLPRDGSTQSTVTVTVRDASNRPKAGQRLSILSDIGTVTPSEVETGSDGRATFAFTAPAPGTIGNAAQIQVVLVGSSADAPWPRVLNIAMTGPSNSTAPAPAFTTTPANPERGAPVQFDASTTMDEGVACLDRCTYSWDFGDGSSGSGRVVSHTFSVGRAHTVTLTVTDAAGSSASKVQVVNVAGVPAPGVTLAVTPDPPFVDNQAVFVADAKPAPGHSIERYEWNFGDGSTQVTTTPSVVKTYTAIGTYVATVTAYDDLGQAGIAAKTVIVGYSVSAPVAVFTVTPASPTAGENVSFNGSGSSVGLGATIVSYVFDPGDGQSAVNTGTTSATVVTYSTAGTYVATLTITDSLGRQATKAVTVVVQ